MLMGSQGFRPSWWGKCGGIVWFVTIGECGTDCSQLDKTREGSKKVGRESGVAYNLQRSPLVTLPAGPSSPSFTSPNSTSSWGPSIQNVILQGTFNIQTVAFCPLSPKAHGHLIIQSIISRISTFLRTTSFTFLRSKSLRLKRLPLSYKSLQNRKEHYLLLIYSGTD